jgi:hypothetical protein
MVRCSPGSKDLEHQPYEFTETDEAPNRVQPAQRLNAPLSCRAGDA